MYSERIPPPSRHHLLMPYPSTGDVLQWASKLVFPLRATLNMKKSASSAGSLLHRPQAILRHHPFPLDIANAGATAGKLVEGQPPARLAYRLNPSTERRCRAHIDQHRHRHLFKPSPPQHHCWQKRRENAAVNWNYSDTTTMIWILPFSSRHLPFKLHLLRLRHARRCLLPLRGPQRPNRSGIRFLQDEPH